MYAGCRCPRCLDAVLKATLVPVAKAAAAALGKPVPQVVDDFAERARASRPESSGPGSRSGSVSVPPEAPRFQPMPSPGGGPVAGAVPYYSGSGGVVDTVSDVAEVAVVVALIPVEITFGIIGGFVDLFD